MRRLFLLAAAALGAWGGVHLVHRLADNLLPDPASGDPTLVSALFLIPAGLAGALLATVILGLLLPPPSSRLQ